MTRISLTVDGEARRDDVEPRRLLVDWLGDLGRPGPGSACDDARCGRCTVNLDGRSVKSCNVLAVQTDGAVLTTVEGLSPDGRRPPVAAALAAAGAQPCAGVVMAAVDLLREHPRPSEEQIRRGLWGHTCGCVSEQDLVDGVLAAAAARQPGLASVTKGAS